MTVKLRLAGAVSASVPAKVIDRNGRRNWVFHRLRAPSAPSDSADASSPRLGPGTVTVTDGEARYFDQRGGRKWAADAIALTAAVAVPDGPLDAHASAIYSGDRIDVALTLAAPEDLRNGGVSAAVLNIAAPRGSLSFDGEVGSAAAAKAVGKFEFHAPSFGELAAEAAQLDPPEAPAQRPPFREMPTPASGSRRGPGPRTRRRGRSWAPRATWPRSWRPAGPAARIVMV